MIDNNLLDPLYVGDSILPLDVAWKDQLSKCIKFKEFLGEKYSSPICISISKKSSEYDQAYMTLENNQWTITYCAVSYHNGDVYASSSKTMSDVEVIIYLNDEYDLLEKRVKDKIKKDLLEEAVNLKFAQMFR